MSTLTVRKLNVDLSPGFPRHWMGGDVYRTAFMNALSMSFPLGEQMFIDSVRAAPPEALLDPLLRAEVKDFVGQEASHRFVHQQFNAELARQGFESWHAAEELEHKAVAFDVYRAAGGGYWKRVFWYLHVSLAFWLDTSLQTLHNLRRDRAVRRPGTWTSAARAWFGWRGMAWSLLKPGLGYLSPRFHPWKHDNRALLRMWLERNEDSVRAIGSTQA